MEEGGGDGKDGVVCEEKDDVHEMENRHNAGLQASRAQSLTPNNSQVPTARSQQYLGASSRASICQEQSSLVKLAVFFHRKALTGGRCMDRPGIKVTTRQ
ncbi:hypothetical protein J3458_020066 [Metarhizium acridum]|uniref:uncharacterized protein n=1 Tax=Metarhizium acridum TaxID=92637 RepID=UPI001C6CD668|nr:hypothetical protein J3458_020144 [Metarhizium acridum]KAG8409065.1 hypothetical protein J3458_020066 [Metarhizium acridum]